MAATKFPWRTVLNYYTSIVLGQPSTPDSWRTGDRLTEFSSKSPLMDVQKDSLTLWAPPLPHTGASTASGDPSYFPGGRWTLYLLQFYSSFPKDYHYGGKMFFLLNKNLLSILYPTETSPPLSPESNRGEIVSMDKWQWEGWVEDIFPWTISHTLTQARKNKGFPPSPIPEVNCRWTFSLHGTGKGWEMQRQSKEGLPTRQPWASHPRNIIEYPAHWLVIYHHVRNHPNT